MARFLSVWTGIPFPIDLITSDSMSPSLMEGDVIAWTPTTMDEIEIGDVVVFKSYVRWPDEKLVVHRVTDIKTDGTTGRPILETKGDANVWVDQKGPHIPEPYIREDHLLGKPISIAQQPLKIPFVGYLGIWINQGLESLSQSTASKGALGYVGVFAPLTLSAIILVVLMFILPEKAKTVKEKLRFYILGSKPLSIKKATVFFLVAYIAFLMFIHCFAYDSITASVGVETSSQESSMNFGRITRGVGSSSSELPLINPGVMPVKGIVFGRGNLSQVTSKEVFELEPGGFDVASLQASASNETQNGSYLGDIMIYSSPFWLIFPNELITNIYSWNADATVYILDILVALFLTFITVSLLALITVTTDGYTILTIERSWHHASKFILKKGIMQRMHSFKENATQSIGKRFGWIGKIDLAEIDEGVIPLKSLVKPILASSVVVPLIFLISDQIIAMVIASIAAGLIAYFISCKIRRKIILATVLTTCVCITYMLLQSNITLLAREYTTIELIALEIGAVGIYLLLLTIFFIPLSLISWYLTCLMRNLKEQKDPLLMLEGSCDL